VTKKKVKRGQRLRGRGLLFIISAPSGAGKTTLCQELSNIVPGLKHSVSYTTRPPRKGEINNVHYSFISQSRFKKMIERREFAEWAMVHGHLYGTSIKRLEEINKKGYDIILDIDTHGAMQMKRKYKNAIYIFILPPSMKALGRRLRDRMSESEEEIRRRLKKAEEEIAQYKFYDYIVINDKFEKALRDLESIIIATRLKTTNADHTQIKRIIEN
jgi:guanylate kinase